MSTIAVDFDGVCRHRNGHYDPTEQDIPGAVLTIKRLKEAGHTVKILTARHPDDLDECYHFVNSNRLNIEVTHSPEPWNMRSKIEEEWDWLIDDADELREEPGVIWHLNWARTKETLNDLGLLP